ncbi:MAG: TIM barrel protein [Endomicrobiales bacterium]
MIRFGTHCSLREGLTGALREAARIGCPSVQIFTRSPRMWKMRPPSSREAGGFRALRRELDIRPLVVHTPYLPNLATSVETLYALSVESLIKDLEVSEELGADYLVIHPGSYSPDASAVAGILAVEKDGMTPGGGFLLDGRVHGK